MRISLILGVLITGLILSPQRAFSQPQVDLEIAFPELRFTRPVDFQHVDMQLFVVEQAGNIWTFTNDQQTTQRDRFLDIRDRVSRAGNEEGLLGLAFHPDYATNGFFYVYYSASSPRRSVLARYSVSPNNPLQAEPSSEQVILTINQPAGNHNGGQIAFGPDGYLYIGIGDGGGANDEFRNGQNRTTLLGTIARIDVDQTPYGIPVDNPFAGSSTFREEIYAWGLRNPWRFSFDYTTGYLYAADVGQANYEEINVIENGGNYGWNIMEGMHCFRTSNCDRSGLILPIFEYEHRGRPGSVTGGHVYYGPRVPDLFGWYVFADYVDGRTWGLVYDGNTLTQDTLLLNSRLAISGFGTDHKGEVYVLAFDGYIYRFTAAGGSLGFEHFIDDILLTQGMEASNVELPSAEGGTSTYVYTLSPELPAGLTFDSNTRQITGAPVDSLPPTDFEYHVTDATGREGVQEFTLQVESSIRTSASTTPDRSTGFVLHGNYPNPFSDKTMISFDLQSPSEVSLDLLDVWGRRVLSIPPRRYSAGEQHTINMPTRNIPGGPYLCRLTADSGQEKVARTITILLVR